MAGNNKIMILMKKMLSLFFLLAMCSFVYAGNTVNVVISDGLDNQILKDKIEKKMSLLLSEINEAQASQRNLNFEKLALSPSVTRSLSMLWENTPFMCSESEIVERCLETGSGYQIRNIPLEMKPRGDRPYNDNEYQEAVVSFNKNGDLESFYLSISMNLYLEVIKSNLELTDLRRRQLILDYVEQFRTAYNQKDLDFLEQVFSDDALIITGKVVKRAPMDGIKMPDFLVMTSGNVSGAPICRSDEEALEELSEFCDCILSHNRKIRVRADDSVMDFYKNRPYMIRRSRGYAPLPIQTSGKWKGQVLAVGGELKNTFCIGVDSRFYPSAYVGDLEDLRTVNALKETIQRMETLLEVEPGVVVCDMHPKYNSTVVAEELGLPVLKVQHHYAHILSCMAENDWMEQVIGVSFDGTGYGTDGTIWGGEILLADLDGFRRIGSVEPFLQAGGDLSAKEGWRIAVSLIWQISESKDEAMQIIQKLGLCEEKEAKVQLAMLERKINAVESTSAGRLFDGISAILGIRKKSSFEGEASMALEFAAEAYEKRSGEKKINVLDGQKCLTESADDGRELLQTGRLVKTAVEIVTSTDVNIAEDTSEREVIEKAAYGFHKGLAEQIVTACIHAKEKTGCQTAALSGGVFQNGLLLRLTEDGLIANGFHVLTHQMIPPNDGGIALGQAFYGMNHECVEEAPIL